MLAGRGYEVVAVSGKTEADDYLREIGAARVLRRQDIDLGSKPIEKALWAGAVDNLGGAAAHLAHAHRGPVGQHRQHRARRPATNSTRP